MIKLPQQAYIWRDETVVRRLRPDLTIYLGGWRYQLPDEQPFVRYCGCTVPVRVINQMRLLQLGKNRYNVRQFKRRWVGK